MEDAAARRARLKSLRVAAEAAGEANPQAENPARATETVLGEEPREAPVLKFRNYAPRDEKIEHEKAEAAKAPEFEEIQVDTDAVTGKASEEETILNVAPKKANWDLRRDIAPKLVKLERRTQRAVIELMAEEQTRREALELNNG